MRASTWIKGLVLLAVTFAAGVAVGITYERRQAPSHVSKGTGDHDAIHHLARELDLDPSQQQAISEILARRQSDVDAAWHAMRPHMRATIDSTAQEIIAVLRPDQAAKYRKMMERAHTSQHR